MLIQSVNNMAQPHQSARPSGNGGADIAATTHSNVGTMPSVTLELPQVAAKQIAKQQPTTEQLQQVTDNINKMMKQSARNLEFSVDADTKKPVVKLIDTETGDVIRQIPSEEALAISRAIDNFQKGMLFNQKA